MQEHFRSATFIGTTIGMAVVLGVLLWPWPDGTDMGIVRVGAAILATIVLYLSQIVPEYLTSFAFMLLAVIFGFAPSEIAFSGFQTSAVWLLFGGLFISVAVRHAGLDEQIGALAGGFATLRYPTLIFAIVFAGLAAGFFLPATISRIIILLPLAYALSTRIGFTAGSPGRMGMALAMGLGTFYPTMGLLPANMPVVAMAGAVEAVHGLSITFGEYMLWHFLILSIVKAILLGTIIIYMFPDKRPELSETDIPAKFKLNAHQGRVIFLLAATLALWATDFVHGIAPGYVALLAAMIILVPGFGFAPKDTLGNTDLSVIFHLAGVMAVGAVVDHTGLGKVVAGFLIDIANPIPGHNVFNFASLSLISSLLSAVTTSPGNPAVFAPIAQDLATATGFSLKTVVMIGFVGMANPIFPYLAPPIVVTYVMVGMPVRTGLKLVALMWVCTTLLLWPLVFVYWRFMDLI
ncbi:MAG: SLC13 family permease [Rhodospirillales bacterium]